MSRRTLLDRSEPTTTQSDVTVHDDPAIAIVDAALVVFAGRVLISGDEVVNHLLDLRNALASAALLRELDGVRAGL
jgi:hypothetical protein